MLQIHRCVTRWRAAGRPSGSPCTWTAVTSVSCPVGCKMEAASSSTPCSSPGVRTGQTGREELERKNKTWSRVLINGSCTQQWQVGLSAVPLYDLKKRHENHLCALYTEFKNTFNALCSLPYIHVYIHTS